MQEWRTRDSVSGHDPADEDGMVAAIVGRPQPAVDPPHRAIQDRGACNLGAVSDAVELLVCRPLGEPPGHGLPTRSEDVHGERARPVDTVMGIGLTIDARQHQGRVQRNRSDGARRQAARNARRLYGGHHRHSRREVCQDTTELGGFYRHGPCGAAPALHR